MGEIHSKWKQPIKGFQASRRHLPHIELENSLYFTTSTTKFRRKLASEDRDVILASILRVNGEKYDLEAAVVMPDHVHLIVQPLPTPHGGCYSLADIFQSIKGYASFTIGKGPLWQTENFDHLIRNEKDLSEKLHYLIYNPVEAKLCDRPEDYPWLWLK